MDVGFLSLFPPLAVLCLGYLTRRVLFSLSCGVFIAAFIAKGFDLSESVWFGLIQFWNVLELTTLCNPETFWESWNAFICIFLMILGVFITLIHHCGGAYAYEAFIKKKLKSHKQVEASSLLLSKSLCIDDYFSSLTVGSVMHPITDSYKIPRAKLAFLVDSLAAPLTVLCPVSSWVAAIVGFLRENGVHAQASEKTQIIASPFLAYLKMIPFILYSFIIIMGAWYIVLKGISFGNMKKHEDCARKTGNVFNGKSESSRSIKKPPHMDAMQPSLSDFFIPIGMLVFGIISGILHSGGCYFFGGNKGIIDSLRDASAAHGLFIGGSFALLGTLIYFFVKGRLKFTDLPRLTKEGCLLMGTSCMVLILAWTLGGILKNDLATGEYLASMLIGKVSPMLVPAMFFCASAITSFAIGSAWGTAAIMFPIGIQLVLAMLGLDLPASMEDVSLLFPTLGAILSGCVAGDHISPISDTTIMTSTSTAMEHTDHVETQMTYALPLIIITVISYIFLGYLVSLGTFASFSITLMISGIMIAGVLNLGAKNSLSFEIFKRKPRFEKFSD
ncbi:MAG: Na+/H+ antiporter NhaC family protein [Oligoflexales bacterium]